MLKYCIFGPIYQGTCLDTLTCNKCTGIYREMLKLLEMLLGAQSIPYHWKARVHR